MIELPTHSKRKPATHLQWIHPLGQGAYQLGVAAKLVSEQQHKPHYTAKDRGRNRMKRYMTTRKRVTLRRRELGIRRRGVRLVGSAAKLLSPFPEALAVLLIPHDYALGKRGRSAAIHSGGLKARGMISRKRDIATQPQQPNSGVSVG